MMVQQDLVDNLDLQEKMVALVIEEIQAPKVIQGNQAGWGQMVCPARQVLWEIQV